ncbi:hypothetical protein [Brevundimonas diminuta]|uniref:hypothetical protein n=1 Tax=Brevundimonas diminuta TaxID=293 RepID=UPI003D9A1342
MTESTQDTDAGLCPHLHLMASDARGTETWTGQQGSEEGFFRLALEAMSIESWESRFAKPVPLAPLGNLTICYLGEGSRDDGGSFVAFRFEGKKFNAILGIETDMSRVKLHRSGELDDFERTNVLLRMFEGRLLPHPL